MSQELLYTSAPRGLKPGSRGFCTVLSTQGMAAPLAAALESLSGYRPIFPAGDPRASRNPVVASHLKLQAAGRTLNVLSRIADFGLDYSQRANKLAHHVVLDKSELLPGGPANLLSASGFMRDEWQGEPKVVALKPVRREPPSPRGVCRAWEEIAGDAGWAGVLAESFLRDPERLVILLFAPGPDVLPLFHEAISLLPPEQRWNVTFSTYFTGLAPGATCVWRAMVHDSKEAHESLRFVNALRLDLTSGSLGPATGGDLVAAARAGTRPHDSPRPARSLGPTDEEFVELETAHEEFAAGEKPAEHIQFAGVPPTPPQLAPNGYPLPMPAASTSQPKRRRLADEVEKDSRRAPSRRWLWLSLTAIVLIIAASSTFGIATGRVQISKLFPKPAQQAQALNGQTPPVAATPNAKKDEPAIAIPVELVAANTPAAVAKPAAETPPGSSPAISVAASKTDDTKPNSADLPSQSGDPSPGNNAQPIPPAQTPQPKIVHAPILLKSEETELKLAPFSGRVAKPPALHVPSWLQSIKTTQIKPSSKATSAESSSFGIEIKEKQNDLGGPFARITVLTDKSQSAVSTVKLDAINPKKFQELGWCALTVHLVNENGIDEQHRIALSPFPINPVQRRLKDDSIANWSIGLPVHNEQTLQPRMQVEQLVVRVGNKKSYSFRPKSNEPMPSVELQCDELSSDVTILEIGDKEKITASVRIDADSKSKEPHPTIRLNLDKEKKAALLDRVRIDLHDRVIILRNDHEKLLTDLAKAFGALSVADKADPEQFTKVGTTIDEMTKTVEKNTSEFKADLIKAKLAFTKLHEDVKKHREWVTALRDCEIVAARISYRIEIPGEDEALTVYIVNFDDTAKDDSQQKGDGK